ncbi:MAG: ABC transporter permease, partial [Candidatus Nanohaloarchaea archaeon]
MKLYKAKFVWKLAKRDILEDRKVSLIVVVMLSFAFLNLVFFPAFITGLSHTFTEGLIEGQTGHVAVEAEEGYLENPEALANKISRLQGVENVEKVLTFRASAVYSGEAAHVTVKGTDSPDFEGYTSKMMSGSFLKQGSDEAVIGRFIAAESEKRGIEGLGIDRGQIFVLRGENFSREFRVRGIIGTKGGIAGMSKRIYVTFEQAEQMLGVEHRASKVKVILEDREASDDFKKRLQALNTQGEIRTWREQSNMAEGISGTFAIVINVLSIVGLIVALAAIGVVIFINTS